MAKKIENAFAPNKVTPPKSSQGYAGYDNARENIDPHIKTQAINTSEVYAKYVNSRMTVQEADKVALNVVSTNELSSAVWVTGEEIAHGTVKISHNQPSVDDSGAAGVSINLLGATTKAQGLFIDMNASTGKAIHVTNGTVSSFTHDYDGATIITSDESDALLVQKEDGTDVFKVSPAAGVVFTKKTIPISTASFDLGDSTHEFRNVYISGAIIVGGASGASGSFTTADGKTVTVTNGVITNIV